MLVHTDLIDFGRTQHQQTKAYCLSTSDPQTGERISTADMAFDGSDRLFSLHVFGEANDWLPAAGTRLECSGCTAHRLMVQRCRCAGMWSVSGRFNNEN